MSALRYLFAAVCLCLSVPLPASELKPFDGVTPELALPDLAGNTHSIADYAGKVLLVHFWATYCTPCRTEMPSMDSLQQQMNDKLAILAVDMGETKGQVQKFVDEVGPRFTVLLDEQGEAIQAWKVFAVPSTFVLDPKGKIRYTLYGATEWDTLAMQQKLSALLP